MEKRFYLPERVREIREAQGISKKTLADRTNVALMTIYRVENGEHCSMRLLQRIADQLQCSVMDLLNPALASPKNFSPDN